MALYDLAQQLKLIDHIDRHVPKAGTGPSVGTYLLLAAVNRCVAPRSKVQMARWFEGTALRRLLDVRPQQLTSQRFWDHMARVSPQAIQRIERDLTDHLVARFEIDVRRVLFDATNFFTFIDSFNQRCTLAQRGKSKEGRAALRIVGLALLVTADFHIPLCHHTYPGNQPDGPTFAGLTAELIDRHRRIAGQVESVTLIFDKGNCSADNLQAVEASPYHFISSLVPTYHPELLKIPPRQFHSLEPDGLPGVRAYRTTKEVFGVERTVVVTYNEALFVAQSRTLLREIAKRQHHLHELQARLLRHQKGRGPRRPAAHDGRDPQDDRRLPEGAAHEGVVRDRLDRAGGIAGAEVPVPYGGLAGTCNGPCWARRSCSPTRRVGATRRSCAAIGASTRWSRPFAA